jgi:cephalosporin hydroxylase
MRSGRVEIDLDSATVSTGSGDTRKTFPLQSAEGFSVVSDVWLRTAWDCRYTYGFSWLGRPIIQIPEDLMRLQEVVYRVKPDVIIETGVAHGGGQVFLASLCHAIGRGRVIGVDIEFRLGNRNAIEGHELSRYITLIEGSSTASSVVEQASSLVQSGETVMVVLDSNHSRDHVLHELELYGPLVTPGSYIIATDGIMERFAGAPGSGSDWEWNNPKKAVEQFLQSHPEFNLEIPSPPFNEGLNLPPVTHWPSAYLRRLS